MGLMDIRDDLMRLKKDESGLMMSTGGSWTYDGIKWELMPATRIQYWCESHLTGIHEDIIDTVLTGIK